MRRRSRTRSLVPWLGGLVLGAATWAVLPGGGPALAQEAADPVVAPGGGMPDAEMMQRWMEAMTPGPEHAAMGEMIGSWTTETTIWMDPELPPQRATGTAEIDWLMDGRYLREEMRGELMGMPFHGFMIMGYDNIRKQYVGVWCDNMGTGLSMSRGHRTEDGSTTVMFAEMDDPMTREIGRIARIEAERIDDDHAVMRMYDVMGGERMQTMEIRYQRMR